MPRCADRRAVELFVTDGDPVFSSGRRPSARTIGMGIGAARSVIGAVLFAQPVFSVRLLGLDTATAARVTWLARMAAARDAVIGIGTVSSSARRRGQRGWLLAGAAADLADALVLTQALREGRAKGTTATGTVAVAAAAAVLATWAAAESSRR